MNWKIDIGNGKYTYVFTHQGAQVFRHGEPWKDATGDKFLYCMAAEIEQLRQQRDELLTALDELMYIVQDAIDQRSAKDLDSFTLQPARAAIARVKGEAK